MQFNKRLAVMLATLAVAGLSWGAVDFAAVHHSSRAAGATVAAQVSPAGTVEIDWP